MARWISDDGMEIEIRLSGSGMVLEKQDIHGWVGDAVGIFVLDSEFVMIADISGRLKGATRNIKAINLLRRSAFEPLAEIYGSVLIATYSEASFHPYSRQSQRGWLPVFQDNVRGLYGYRDHSQS